MINISSFTLKFLGASLGQFTRYASGMGAQRCVWGKNLNVFNCFDQLSMSELQQMEVELKIRESVNFTA